MKRMTSKLVKHSAVLVQTLGLCSPAFAETYLYPDYGDLFTFDPKYTAISVGKGPGVVSFSSDVKFTDFGYRHFNTLIAGDSRSSSPTNLEFRGFSFQDILSGGTGAVKALYLAILVSHVLLSIGIVPMCLAAFWFAWKREFPRHTKVTRWLHPIWLYVSVTGVVVFLMLRPYY